MKERKKVISSLLITISILMLFSMTAFAADNASEAKQPASSVQPMASQQPVTSVTIIEKGIWNRNFGSPALDSMNGHVYFVVRTMGHGKDVATYDYASTKEFWYEALKNYGGTVIGFERYYDCGLATPGTHTFRIKTTSYGSPYNTIQTSGTITN